MGRKKTTVYVDEDLLRDAKVMAARTGRRDSEIFEEALKLLLGRGILERAGRGSPLGEEESLALAYQELHAARATR